MSLYTRTGRGIMPGKRRHRPAGRAWGYAVPGALWLVIALCAAGFVRLTQLALYRQAHGVVGAEHPYDWGADGCLVLAMAAVALLLLSRPVVARRVQRKARPLRRRATGRMQSTKRGIKRRRERVQ